MMVINASLYNSERRFNFDLKFTTHFRAPCIQNPSSNTHSATPNYRLA